MSEIVAENIDLTLEANSEEEVEVEEIYSTEITRLDCVYYWCIKCQEMYDFDYYFNLIKLNKIMNKRQWKCERCKPKVKSICTYSANSQQEAYKKMIEDIQENPYEEPFWLCEVCLTLHDDNYKGKCQAHRFKCKNMGEVCIYWGENYEYAKNEERLRREKEVNDDNNNIKREFIFGLGYGSEADNSGDEADKKVIEVIDLVSDNECSPKKKQKN
tara:strand:+ start:5379 stop:6023 length:645 start_codon:yes stop_codon:yes gene_type:complete